MKMSLKAARINAGYKSKDVAKILGVCASRVAQIENGHRPIKPGELEKMAMMYGVSEDDIRLEARTSGKTKIFAQ